MLKVIGLLAVGLALGGCAGGAANSGAVPDAGGAAPTVEAPPLNYREIAIAEVKKTFFDPYSIRDAEIAAPKRAAGPSLNEDGFKTPWVICVRANAKNRMGAYAGRKVTALAISGGRVVNAWDEAQYSRTVCDGVAYEPFPEIEEGYRPAAASAAKKR